MNGTAIDPRQNHRWPCRPSVLTGHAAPYETQQAGKKANRLAGKGRESRRAAGQHLHGCQPSMSSPFFNFFSALCPVERHGLHPPPRNFPLQGLVRASTGTFSLRDNPPSWPAVACARCNPATTISHSFGPQPAAPRHATPRHAHGPWPESSWYFDSIRHVLALARE